MILEQLHIDSFAGLSDGRVDFKPGLNIMLGPNEAGKSTLFHVITHILFTPARLTKRRFEMELGPFLPLGGGDSIGGRLAFAHLGGRFELFKRWGQQQESELLLPDGSRVRQEQSIAERLRDMLPAGEATVRAVLMTYQSSLAGTLTALRQQKETVHTFADILRRTVLETGGVSVERFRELLDEKCSGYFERWDVERNRPEGGRDIDNPYKRGLGSVLTAYYRLRRLSRNLEEAVEKETALAELSAELEGLVARAAEKRGFIEGHSQAVEDARKRSVLEHGARAAEQAEVTLKRDYDGWPEVQKAVAGAEKRQAQITDALGELERQKTEAQGYDNSQELRNRHGRAVELKQHLIETQKQLDAVPPVARGVLDEIQQAADNLTRMEARVSSDTISLVFTAKKDLALDVTRESEDKEQEQLSTGDVLELLVPGRITLDHQDWRAEIAPGNEDFNLLESRFLKEKQRFASMLAAVGASSLEEARESARRYSDLQAQAALARDALQRELGDLGFDELEASAKAASRNKPSKTSGLIGEELGAMRTERGSLAERQAEARAELDRLAEQHGDREALFDKLLGVAARRKALLEEMAALAPLPEGFADVEDLTGRYESEKREKAQIDEAERNMSLAVARAEENMPDESSEEITVRLGDAEESFRATLERGRTLARIAAATGELLRETEHSLPRDFDRLIAGYIGEITRDRYRDIRTDQSLPDALVRQDGQIVPYELLSAGTKDVFSLTLRLAMAAFFLQDKEGFLIMDDPLVDLDPERRRLAANLLCRFSAARQLILFTCHPSHAELFEAAHRVSL